jgi:hypothetical protein
MMDDHDLIKLLIRLTELVHNHESRIRSDSVHRIALEDALLPLLSGDQQSQYRAKIAAGILATQRGSDELSETLTAEIQALRKKLGG